MSHEFYVDAMNRSGLRNMRWYRDNLAKLINLHKEKRVGHMDETLALTAEFLKAYSEPKPLPIEVPIQQVANLDNKSQMRPVEPEVLELLYGSTGKGFSKRYLLERYKKWPVHRFYIRDCTSWDYGWQPKQTRNVNHGRRFILKNTFYRKNNVAPDAPSYSQPSSAVPCFCSAEYLCYFN